MGALCSTSALKEGFVSSPDCDESKSPNHYAPRLLRKMPAAQKSASTDRTHWQALIERNEFRDAAAYERARAGLVGQEKAIAFDARVQADASDLEKHAMSLVKNVRDHDWDTYYSALDVAGESSTGKRSEGAHFLGNVDTINQTELFKITRAMPKGAHLHIHFNACLPARFLIQHARKIPTMYIKSSLSLADFARDRRNQTCLDKTRIQFNVSTKEDAIKANAALSPEKAPSLGNIWSPDYVPNHWQSYQEFAKGFPGGIKAMEDWLVSKCLISEEQAHGSTQSTHGIWAQFNFRTQFMKGLFSYESAFRAYTRACVIDFAEDNIQYAEIRPNFMANNSVKKDDASGSYDNFETLEIIREEYFNAVDEIKKRGDYFGGLKVIYCHPRIFSPPQVVKALEECLAMKLKRPEFICGFDLVGEEEMGNELRIFTKEFLDFQQNCKKAGVDIPFLFHCGETLESGGKTDGNLYDAILLNAKRIGHGYSLAQHPLLMEIFKKKGMAIEACPISNEVLGLTSTVAGHHLHQLLANNIPCTLNSDNGTFYRSSLSHDFYQAMIGSENMTLLGWKQLAQWSLEHSCMDVHDKEQVTAVWQHKWDEFCQWIVDTYGNDEVFANYVPPASKDSKKPPPRRPGHEWTNYNP
ncbi:metallo-dependent hydrolase-2 [Coleophoma crateriformis]|uniref:adenosine deaminase n=1 Tax=Coleophoma crateriformis TaxID=565419 RepID=A0A3D8T8V3_9HELO|nr:metallo-dependent hydrolase-2 [Coleophoma crateriformis]